MSPFQAPPELIGHAGANNAFAFYNPKRSLYVVGTLNQIVAPSRGFMFMLKVLRAIDKGDS